MVTFTRFLNDAVEKGEAVNTLFEERLFDLVGVLHLTYARGQRAEDILSVRNALGTPEYGEKAMA